MAAQDLEGFQTGQDRQSSKDRKDHWKVVRHFEMVESSCIQCRCFTHCRYCRHARRQEGVFTPRRPTQLGRAPQRWGWVTHRTRTVIDRCYCSAGNNDHAYKALVLFISAATCGSCAGFRASVLGLTILINSPHPFGRKVCPKLMWMLI